MNLALSAAESDAFDIALEAIRRAIELDTSGKETSRMEVTQIEKKGRINRRVRIALAHMRS